MTNTSTPIPVIDLKGLVAGDSGAPAAVARQVTEALETIGFFGIRNHGVDEETIAAGFDASRAFHAEPLDRKLTLKINNGHRGYMPMADQHRAEAEHPNLSASFLCGVELAADDPDVLQGLPLHAVNQWPASLPDFREAMEDYHRAMTTLGLRLVDVFETALEVEPGYFSKFFEKPMAFIRALQYPPAPADIADVQFGAAPHSAFGFVTILAQDDVGGLQVQTLSGDWIDAPNQPGVLLVNIGDMLMRWTNDRFRSTVHRVVNAEGVERYSIPFFFDPSFDARVECIDSCCSPDNPPQYPATSWGAFLNDRFNANHKYRNEADAA